MLAFMVDTTIFNLFKWQKLSHKNSENTAGHCVWGIQEVFVRLELNCFEAVV